MTTVFKVFLEKPELKCTAKLRRSLDKDSGGGVTSRGNKVATQGKDAGKASSRPHLTQNIKIFIKIKFKKKITFFIKKI